MNFGEVIHIWWRRRGLTAGLVILALAGIAAAVAWLPRAYQSQGSVVLLASPASSRVNGGNPYLSFTSSIALTADVVSRELMSPDAARRLAEAGFTAAYTVGPDPNDSGGSVLDIAVTGSDPGLVQRTVGAVIAQVRAALASLQGRVRPGYRIRVATLSGESTATLAISHTARPMVVIALAGLLGALATPVLVDGRLSRRGLTRGAPRARAGGHVGQLVDG